MLLCPLVPRASLPLVPLVTVPCVAGGDDDDGVVVGLPVDGCDDLGLPLPLPRPLPALVAGWLLGTTSSTSGSLRSTPSH